MKRLAILSTFITGCAWTTFDDLADTTPAQAIEKPDGVKATDFGIAIIGVTMDSTGGRLAVLSSGSGNYSTLDFDGHGKGTLGDNENLGIHTIDSLTGAAMLLTDGAGQVAVVDNSNVGTVVDIHGPATGLNVDTQVGFSQKPDAATFAPGGKLIVLGTAAAGMPNAVAVPASGVVVPCTLQDNLTMPLSAAAIAVNGSTLWVWTKSGTLLGYPLTIFDGPTCPANPVPTVLPTISPAPAQGGNLSFTGAFAVLTSFDTSQTMTGSVSVIDTSAGGIVGTPIAAHGAHSAVLDTFGGMPALVLGYPNRTVGSATNVGEVEIHPIDSTGVVSALPSETISIPQADGSLVFGRYVTTMKHNGATVLVVSASNTLFAYYKTSLYPDTRTP